MELKLQYYGQKAGKITIDRKDQKHPVEHPRALFLVFSIKRAPFIAFEFLEDLNNTIELSQFGIIMSDIDKLSDLHDYSLRLPTHFSGGLWGYTYGSRSDLDLDLDLDFRIEKSVRVNLRWDPKKNIIDQRLFLLFYLFLNTSSHLLVLPTNSDNFHKLHDISIASPPRDIDRGIDTAELLKLVRVTTGTAAQTIEFIEWLQDRYPNLDILASVPTSQIREIVAEFCEEKKYENASTFKKDVLKWIKGEADSSIFRRLISIGKRAKENNKTLRSSVSPFKRYQTVPYHAIFLFLSAGDFPGFIQKYWEDLNHLTGDHLDIYYSFEDIERRVSAFETLEQFRSLQVETTALPAILLWKASLTDSCVVPLGRLSHDDVFDTMKLIVQCIEEDKSLQEICIVTNDLVESRIESLSPGPKIIIRKGDLKMGRDTYNVGQAGAVGPNAHAHDITFTQIGAQIEESTDLMQLAKELSQLRQAMKEEAVEAEHDIAVSDVAKAEQAAKSKDAPKVAEHLRSAGKWALEIATKIGVPVAVEALKQVAGIG